MGKTLEQVVRDGMIEAKVTGATDLSRILVMAVDTLVADGTSVFTPSMVKSLVTNGADRYELFIRRGKK